MLSFVQSWFGSSSSPIGVDFGNDTLRLAQVEEADADYRLVAAASADVPPHVRNEPLAKFSFFCDTIRDLLAQGNFRGRKVMLNLPASMMHIQHLRLPKMDEEALKKALPWEARGKLPFDPSQAVLRHLIAGEIYHDQEPKYEVVLIAARRDLVEQYLAAAAKARLTVAGMNIEPKAIVDCFSHIFRRKTDMDAPTLFADIGCTATRALIARGGRIQFARVVPVGGEHFSRAVASALQIPLDQARLMRIKLAASQENETAIGPVAAPEAAARSAPVAADPTEGTGFALLQSAVSAAEEREAASHATAKAAAAAAQRVAVDDPIATPDEGSSSAATASGIAPDDRRRVDDACREPLSRLIEELSLCRRYYEATFHNQPVSRLVFVGGEANQRSLCQQIARTLGIAAQVGDPLARMGKFSEVSVESGIDRRSPQPGWAVAIGLSMGPAATTGGSSAEHAEAKGASN